MNSGYVNPNNLGKPTSDGVDFSSFVDLDDHNPFLDGVDFPSGSGFTPTLEEPQSYQNAGAAAQQQFLSSIPDVDVSNVSYPAQLDSPYDAGIGFPFPPQRAPQNVETPSTAPSTSRSPESNPRSNDTPLTNNTTSPEANSQPPAAPSGRKRGRKPRVIKNKQEEAEIRQKFLERNRLAASKCREKKRGQHEELQNHVHDLKNKNTQLRHDVEYLRGYIEYLKEGLGDHEGANCGNDRQVMAAMGRRGKKLAVRQKASMNKPLDLDGMSYESESEDVKERQISVDSGVADLSTPTQLMPANQFSS